MAVDSSATNDGFLVYHEPNIIQILILISFFFFLSFGEWLSNKVFRAGLIGQIIVGMIYGLPLGNVLDIGWQQAFVALGYLGLILIIFEGAMAVRLDLLKKNFVLSLYAASIGVILPIGLSYALCYVGFGYGAVETFIIGAALSTTSLGTTFVVISSASSQFNFADTKVGTVLISAAVLDDVSGLVMASVINSLGAIGSGGINLGWLIGRPIVAASAMGFLTPALGKWVFAPLFRYWLEDHWPRYRHTANILLMIFVLSAFLAIAAYSGTSVLYGSFLAGAFISYLPDKHPDGPFTVPSREEGEQMEGKCPTFLHTFEKYMLDAQHYVMEPLFFASVGFAIPFKSLWSGPAIWKGIVYTILMFIGKLAVGFAIPSWDMMTQKDTRGRRAAMKTKFWPSMLLGCAMAARGEIGLLVIQIGLNNTPYLSQDAFITAVWAIVLNTIIGPVAVGFILKSKAKEIAEGDWGVQETPSPEDRPRARSRSRSRANSRAHSRTNSKAHSRATSLVSNWTTDANTAAGSIEDSDLESGRRGRPEDDEKIGPVGNVSFVGVESRRQ